MAKVETLKRGKRKARWTQAGKAKRESATGCVMAKNDGAEVRATMAGEFVP